MRYVIVGLLLGAAAFGDTLEMKDGRLLHGTYMGGTQNTIRFKAKGQTMTLPVQDVVALTLEREGDVVHRADRAGIANRADLNPDDEGFEGCDGCEA